MKNLMVLAVLGTLMAGCDEKIAVRVSPEGKVRTPEEARNAVREIRRRLTSETPVEVVFADGVYRLANPLELTAEDSGTTNAPVVWRAENRGKATFTAATALDWKPLADEKIRALLPAAARDKVLVADVPGSGPLPSFLNGSHYNSPTNDIQIELFQGDERLVCARGPNADFHLTGSADVERSGVGDVVKRGGHFEFDRAKVTAWANEPYPWVFGLWGVYWADLKCPLSHLDVQKARVCMDDPAYIPFGLKEGMPFYVFNCFCELDAPGEWVVDRAQRRIYLWPKDGLPPAEAVIVRNVLTMKGVSDLVVDGIVFEKSRLDAVALGNCERVTMRACAMRHTCAWGVKVDGGRNCRIAGCDMTDLGGGGIALYGGNMKKLERADHVAENNHISHYGKVFFNYRQGIALYGVGNSAVRNLVHHSPHTGIYGCGNDLYIGWNVIHDTCSFNDDAGAIYVWNYSWVRRRVIIEHNVIHFTGKPKFPANTEAIYLDDFSPENVVRYNLINRANVGVVLGGGQCNETYGNVIANCERALELSTRQTWPVAQAGRKSRNYVEMDADYATFSSPKWRAHYPGLARLQDLACDPVTAHHAYWNVVSNNVSYYTGVATKSCWEAISNTTVWADNVQCGDVEPAFRDYWNFDWRAEPGAPHADVINGCGFDKAGLYDSPERLSAPVKFGSDVTKPQRWGAPEAMPTARLSCVLCGKLPEGVMAFAEKPEHCEIPGWAKGTYVDKTVPVSTRPNAPAQTVSYSFVPTVDCTFTLALMGGFGTAPLTEYDGISVTGVTIPKEGLFDKAMPLLANDRKRVASRPLKAKKGEKVTVAYRCRLAP